MLKIENVAAFEHLPELLLTAMGSRKVGVMIARGDLAVEVGCERLAGWLAGQPALKRPMAPRPGKLKAWLTKA